MPSGLGSSLVNASTYALGAAKKLMVSQQSSLFVLA